ncbi:CD276 antigen-like isoform X1 [Salvelinus namaycush]|uniref:CD276 antigen-like isoform X1 n=1 Tax=Salvelinus namaycush TaxID=8040 RepID=A0A8U0UIN3_SALNM|nr:CD276 antigen-like isoform X1 [Salvelinus namaycush]
MLRVVGHLLCLIICCLGADGLTETLVELGQNTIINCSINIESAYWYIQHQPQPPLAILRSFTSSSPAAFYYNNNYRQKYSLETGNSLFIQNVTVDDCGVFYCAKKEEGRLIFSNGTRLMTADVYADYPNQTNQTSSYPNQTSSYPNQTSSYPNQTSSYPNQTSSYPNQTSSYPNQTSNCRSSWENCLLSIYSVLNVILMVMILVLILTLPCQNRNSPSKLTPRRRIDQRCWLPVCVILLIGPQVSSQVNVEGFKGDNVILPCTYIEKALKNVNIFWETADDVNVYSIIDGKADLAKQNSLFINRTSMFSDEWTKGNFSLLLTDLNDSDSGSYLCFIPTEDVLCQVELSVQEKPTPEPTNSSSVSLRGQNLSPFLFLLLSQMLYLL